MSTFISLSPFPVRGQVSTFNKVSQSIPFIADAMNESAKNARLAGVHGAEKRA
jgi:hypothetical protein